MPKGKKKGKLKKQTKDRKKNLQPMTIFTHTIVTAFGIQVLKLSGKEAIFGCIFGIGLDLDHFLKLPLYFKKYGFKKVQYYHWRTFLQEPISLLWVIPLSFYLQSWVPLIFFSSHLFLDYLMAYPKRPFFPFNKFEIKGNPLAVSDEIKELIIFVVFLCLNLLLI